MPEFWLSDRPGAVDGTEGVENLACTNCSSAGWGTNDRAKGTVHIGSIFLLECCLLLSLSFGTIGSVPVPIRSLGASPVPVTPDLCEPWVTSLDCFGADETECADDLLQLARDSLWGPTTLFFDVLQ